MNDDAGAAGLTLVLGIVLVLTVAVAAVTAVADLALTSARARTAADAAALAAVGVSPLARGATGAGASGAGAGVDPHLQARRLAAANHATVFDVEPLGWPLRYGVTVAVDPSTEWVRRLVGPVRASAVAALRPRRPTARGQG